MIPTIGVLQRETKNFLFRTFYLNFFPHRQSPPLWLVVLERGGSPRKTPTFFGEEGGIGVRYFFD